MSAAAGEDWLRLDRSLSNLAASAALADVSSRPDLLALAQGLGQWMDQAAALDKALDPLRQRAQRIAGGLEQGLETAPGLQRLQESIEMAARWVREKLAPTAPAAAAPQAEKQAASGAGQVVLAPGDEEGWQDFLAEAPELLQAMEQRLVDALGGASFDTLAVLRPLHTLKGICGMLGLGSLGSLIHASEEVLQPHRDSPFLPREANEALLLVCDRVRRQIEAVAGGLESGRFEALDCGDLSGSLEKLELHKAGTAATAGAADLSEERRSVENVIRIPVAKMDALLEAVSELAICQAQVTEGVLAQDRNDALAAEAVRLAKISRQMQEVVLSLRMVPVAPLFTRISRQVHDLSKRMGKPLRLELEGGETEVDKGMVEDLFEPLLHLVRNALDHGLESPSERLAAGKAEEGVLRLTAEHQGGEFVLRLSDDGRGFQLGEIAAKAQARGLLKAGEEASPERLIDLLFESGFSTAATLTDLSGRGVGLDAVRRRVQALKGSVRAQGLAGKGSSFTLRLPLTLALMDAVLVRVGAERYAVPASAVLRFLAWDPAQSHAVGAGDAWYEAPGGSLPLVDMGAAGDGRAVAMHLSSGGREACVMVDEVIGKQQVVVKGLGELLKDLPGVAGGAVLSDGRVGLILDLASLLSQRSLN